MESPLDQLVGGAFCLPLNDEARTLMLSTIFQICLTIGVFAIPWLRRKVDGCRSRAHEETENSQR